jgi:hypothetical protein
LINYILPDERPPPPPPVDPWADDYDSKKVLPKKMPPKKYITPKNFNIRLLFTLSTDMIIKALTNMLEYVERSDGIIISSAQFKNDNINIDTGHGQSFFICDGKEMFYDDNGVVLKNEQIGGVLPEHDKIHDEIISYIQDYESIKDLRLEPYPVKPTFCRFEWKAFMTEQITKIISILNAHNSDKIYLSREEINKLYLKFSDLYYTYDKSRKITVQATTIELPEIKTDIEIRYIFEFNFWTLENFDETNKIVLVKQIYVFRSEHV